MAGKRRWFQVHLSTACVLMLFGGGILFAQFKPRSKITDGHIYKIEYGWPKTIKRMKHLHPETTATEYWIPNEWPTNMAFALAILAATAIGCEWVIRRRERKRKMPG